MFHMKSTRICNPKGHFFYFFRGRRQPFGEVFSRRSICRRSNIICPHRPSNDVIFFFFLCQLIVRPACSSGFLSRRLPLAVIRHVKTLLLRHRTLCSPSDQGQRRLRAPPPPLPTLCNSSLIGREAQIPPAPSNATTPPTPSRCVNKPSFKEIKLYGDKRCP